MYWWLGHNRALKRSWKFKRWNRWWYTTRWEYSCWGQPSGREQRNNQNWKVRANSYEIGHECQGSKSQLIIARYQRLEVTHRPNHSKAYRRTSCHSTRAHLRKEYDWSMDIHKGDLPIDKARPQHQSTEASKPRNIVMESNRNFE